MKNPFSRLNLQSKDRNALALQNVAEGQFAARVHAGELSLIDRFGRKVRPGDLVTWQVDIQTIWEIASVKPILDPKAPAGAIQVELRAAGNINALANQILDKLIIVGHHDPVAETAVGKDEIDPRD